jgi:UPF0755 protein
MKKRKIIICICSFLILIAICVAICFLVYYANLKSVSTLDTKVIFTVEKGSTYQSLSKELKKENLIRSELAYKIYLKLNDTLPLQAGTYELNQTMSVEELLNTLGEGSNYNLNAIRITFQEGLVVSKVADIIEQNTNHTKAEFYAVLKDTSYIDTLITKYWFLTNDIKNKNIYYSLEGYLYPNTYEFETKDVSIETIIESMLDSMEKNLEDYKEAITKSNYSVHEIITLASMIQSEGNNISDFKKMASVFLTRLSKNMKLQSCASAYYGDKKVMGVDDFGDSYLKTNAYNTYVISALPVGPISSPGIDAIEAVLYPSDTDYLYFASDKNMKVYFSKTYEEHQKTISELKKAGNWYGS